MRRSAMPVSSIRGSNKSSAGTGSPSCVARRIGGTTSKSVVSFINLSRLPSSHYMISSGRNLLPSGSSYYNTIEYCCCGPTIILVMIAALIVGRRRHTVSHRGEKQLLSNPTRSTRRKRKEEGMTLLPTRFLRVLVGSHVRAAPSSSIIISSPVCMLSSWLLVLGAVVAGLPRCHKRQVPVVHRTNYK